MSLHASLSRLLQFRALRDTTSLSISGLLYHALYLGRGIVAARLLGPELMGMWAAAYILNMYLTNSHLGSLSVVRREMTIAYGAGDTPRADALARAGLTLALVPALLGAVGVSVWTLLRWNHVAPTFRWIVLLVAVLSVMQQAGIFYSFCLYAQERFSEAAASNSVTAVLLLVTTPLIWCWGLPGLAVGVVVSQAVGLAMLVHAAAVPFRLSAEGRILAYLIREGLPFLGSNLIYTLQGSVDRIVILQFYGVRLLGLYSLVLQGQALLNIVVGNVSQVSYSRMGRLFGETGDPSELYRHFSSWPRLLAWAALPILLTIYLVVPPAVSLILPQYREAIPAARLVCLQAFFLTLVVIPAGYLSTIRRLGVYLAIQGVATGLTWVFCVASAQQRMGLAGITLANAAANAAYSLLLFGAAAYFARQAPLRCLASLLGHITPLFLGCLIVLAVSCSATCPIPWGLLLALLVLGAVMVVRIARVRRTGLLTLANRI